MVMEDDLTLGGGHTMQYTYHVYYRPMIIYHFYDIADHRNVHLKLI